MQACFIKIFKNVDNELPPFGFFILSVSILHPFSGIHCWLPPAFLSYQRHTQLPATCIAMELLCYYVLVQSMLQSNALAVGCHGNNNQTFTLPVTCSNGLQGLELVGCLALSLTAWWAADFILSLLLALVLKNIKLLFFLMPWGPESLAASICSAKCKRKQRLDA